MSLTIFNDVSGYPARAALRQRAESVAFLKIKAIFWFWRKTETLARAIKQFASPFAEP